MVRVALVLVWASSVLISSLAAEPIPPNRITLDAKTRSYAELAAEIGKQTGIKISVSEFAAKKTIDLAAKDEPFWDLLERLGKEKDFMYAVSDKGRKIEFFDGKPPAMPPRCVDGAFRVIVKSVTAKAAFDGSSGRGYEVTLEINWEPRLPVFRISSTPTIVAATDDRGAKLTSTMPKTKSAIGDACLFTTTFRLDGLIRDSKKIATLEGTFTVTASPKMLLFTFDDLMKLPTEKEQTGVKMTLVKMVPTDGRWNIEIKLQYPQAHPEFESFETWTDNNKLRLVSADRSKTYTPENFSAIVLGRDVTAEYRFLKLPDLGDRKGWNLAYETPAPLVEFAVKFSLKDIALP